RHVLTAPGDERRLVDGFAAASYHVGLCHLAESVVRHAHDGHLGDTGMGQHDALDLGREGVEASDDEHVLLAVGDAQVPVFADVADVPRAQVPVVVEGGGGGLGI